MTKRTRYFMMGSVGFLTLGLTVGLAAYYGGIRGFAEPAGPNELGYIPSDAAVVAYADVKELMASTFRQHVKALESAHHQHGQEELKDATGIDIEKDIDSVLACMLTPTAGSAIDAKSGYVLARGRFDRPRIEAFVRSKGGVERKYNGRTMFVHPADATEPETEGASHEMALTFVDDKVVAFGTPAALQKVIDLQTSSANTVLKNAPLMKMIKGVDSGTWR